MVEAKAKKTHMAAAEKTVFLCAATQKTWNMSTCTKLKLGSQVHEQQCSGK